MVRDLVSNLDRDFEEVLEKSLDIHSIELARPLLRKAMGFNHLVVRTLEGVAQYVLVHQSHFQEVA